MNNDETEFYAVQKRWYLIRKITTAFNDSELRDSFENNNNEEDNK